MEAESVSPSQINLLSRPILAAVVVGAAFMLLALLGGATPLNLQLVRSSASAKVVGNALPADHPSSGLPSDHPSSTSKEIQSVNEIQLRRRAEVAVRFAEGACCWVSKCCWFAKSIAESPWSALGLLNVSDILNIDGDAYQFGVFSGKTLGWLQAAMPTTFFWGFDSFEGMPLESSRITLKAPDWKPGSYTFQDHRGLQLRHGGPSKVHFFKGWYNESLKNPEQMGQEAGRMLRPAFYVDVDSDLYISTYQALDWMFDNNLMTVGTIIGYDDWWVLSCCAHHHNGTNINYSKLNPMYLNGGEARVHREMAEKYKVKFKCICGTCSRRMNINGCWRPYYIIEAMGEGVKPDHGFELSGTEDLAWFLEKAKGCKRVTGSCKIKL